MESEDKRLLVEEVEGDGAWPTYHLGGILVCLVFSSTLPRYILSIQISPIYFLRQLFGKSRWLARSLYPSHSPHTMFWDPLFEHVSPLVGAPPDQLKVSSHSW